MFKYNCLNPIASVGLDLFSDQYEKVDELKDAQAALVRSAAMHDLELPDTLEAVEEPVPESTIFHLINVQKRVSSYSIHLVQMPMV